MLRLAWIILLVWPCLLPPGVCPCCVNPINWFAADEHSEEHHDDDCHCPGGKKAFLNRTPHETGTLAVALHWVSPVNSCALAPAAPASLCQEDTPAHLSASPALYLIHCALRN